MFNILKQMERVLWEQIRDETVLCSGGPALVINQFGDFTNYSTSGISPVSSQYSHHRMNCSSDLFSLDI